jgi:hypothetical protein
MTEAVDPPSTYTEPRVPTRLSKGNQTLYNNQL